jgi:heptaprenyl diphosphate synthase
MSNCKNENNISSNKAFRELQRLFEQRGRKVFEMAKQAILEEKIESKEIEKAFNYFATEYWRDLARPTLLSLCCEAVGGNPQATFSVAISTSLISGGVDIHDDIIDLSEVKNARPTVYGKFGKDIALLVGDALMFKGLALLNGLNKEIGKEKIAVISKVLKSMFFELGDAEAMELRFRKQFDVSTSEYLAVVRRKAADVEAHTCIGVILGNGTEEETEILSKYGRNLGMLLILVDDNADMIHPEELLHRIRKEHLPFPMLCALEDPKVKPYVISLLKKERLKKVDAEKLFKVVYDSGGFNRVEKIMENLVGEGIFGLEKLRFCKKELEFLLKATLIEKEIHF